MDIKIDWLNNIITAVISIVVTVIAGAILYYWQIEKSELSYSFERIEPFENQTEKLTIYHIKIENSGTTIIEDIEGTIDIGNAEITEYKTKSETPINIIDSLQNKQIKILIKSFNKGEGCKVSILAKSSSELPTEPCVKLRSKGTIGIKIDTEKKDFIGGFNFQFWLIGLTILASLVQLVSKRFVSTLTGKHLNGDQRHIFAYLCGVHNIPEEANRYMSLHETTYWAEADRLGFLAINSQDLVYCEKIKWVLNDVLFYTGSVADESKAIIYFNIAKIEKKLGNIEKVKENINNAKKLSKSLISKRLTFDKYIN